MIKRQKNIKSKDILIEELVFLLSNKYKIMIKNTVPNVIGMSQKPQKMLYGAKVTIIADNNPNRIPPSFFAIKNTNSEPKTSIRQIMK
jgi:hypothetical protein